MRRASSSVLHAFVLTARLSLTLILILAAFIGIADGAWAKEGIWGYVLAQAGGTAVSTAITYDANSNVLTV